MIVPHSPSDIAAYIAAACLILLVPVCLAYLVVLEMLFFRLRRKHPDHYKSIGEPSVLLNNSISKSGNMVRYLLDRDYRAVPDERAVRLGERSRQLFFAGVALFVAVALAFAAFGVLL